MMSSFEVKAYNVALGAAPVAVGPSRSRIKGVLVYGTAAVSFTLKSGSASGETLLDLTMPAGWNDVYIPDNGILAEDGVFVSALTGTGALVTLLLG
jgi:hypothetical protein